MNEVIHDERIQTAAANLQWAFMVLRAYLSTDVAASIEQINRTVYKTTDCGAHVRVTDKAEIIFSSIVEGSEAEFTCDPIATADREEYDVQIDIRLALEWLEGECAAAWNEANRSAT